MTRIFPIILFSWVIGGCISDAPPDSTGTGGSAGTGGNGTDANHEPIPSTPGPMRIVSWNCFNFFDDKLGNCGSSCPFEEKLSTAQYNEKIAGIARGLRELDGDVVVLQEVENKEVLDALVAHPDMADMGYDTRELVFGNDPRGINIGLLSREPIDAYISHKNDQFTRIDNPATVYRFARDAVEIHLTYRGHPVGIVGVHFKARINDEDPDRRVAEAQQARKIADRMLAENPQRYVFVVGDYNDTPGTDTYNAVRNGPTQESVAFEHALASIPMAERYSYQFGNQKQLLDHILANPSANNRLDADSATILHDDTLPSDHRPIAATYTVP